MTVFLAVCMLVTSSFSSLAAREEEYVCELRLVYADTYKEAKDILKSSEFKDYELFGENLNEDTGEIGVWLAYKTTTDIEDAITDMTVMQMNGGYELGNYQEMIKESFNEYVQIGKIYQEAIDYFTLAYDEGHFLAKAAYRQLNFYTLVTDEDLGIKIPSYDGELLGDILYDGIDIEDLATVFMQGNTYALQNIRSLLAMGVSYNEDGKHYLQKVALEAAQANANSGYYSEGEYDDISRIIAGSLITFRDMFKDLAVDEDKLNYYDDEMTDLENDYAEYKSLADRFREVEYLGGVSLYDFCLGYSYDEENLSNLYPLASALNDGQRAMTRVSHYYDVVRYSMSDYPEEVLDELIFENEELFRDNPFNVYTGVDRSIYYGSFALTSDAYRANAYTEDGFLSFMFKEHAVQTASMIVSMISGPALAVWGVRRTAAAKKAAEDAAQQLAQDEAKKFAADKAAAISSANAMKTGAAQYANDTVSVLSSQGLGDVGASLGATYNDVANSLLQTYGFDAGVQTSALNIKLAGLIGRQSQMTTAHAELVSKMNGEFCKVFRAQERAAEKILSDAQQMTQNVTDTATFTTPLSSIALYVVGGILMLYSTFMMAYSVYSYYNPDYEDVPVAMVDLIETIDGDRYIKYDAVYEAEPREKNEYTVGDLNAYEAQRWNALYYTKSYEAGKPLLADEFYVSNSSNKPRSGYAPVRRFGEVVCYDLNKYNFDDDYSIYLSVKRSKKDKSAVTGVPEVVGSIFAESLWVLFSGAGALLGVGGTLGVQTVFKKKTAKTKTDGNE